MKYLFGILVISGILLTGCGREESSVPEASGSSQTETTSSTSTEHTNAETTVSHEETTSKAEFTETTTVEDSREEYEIEPEILPDAAADDTAGEQEYSQEPDHTLIFPPEGEEIDPFQ